MSVEARTLILIIRVPSCSVVLYREHSWTSRVLFISVANGLKTDNIRSQESSGDQTNIQQSHPNSKALLQPSAVYWTHSYDKAPLLSPKIAYLVQKKQGHGLINLPLLVISPSLGTVHVSVADAAKAIHGQAWNLRLSHLVVHKTTREEGTIIKYYSAVWADARFNGF